MSLSIYIIFLAAFIGLAFYTFRLKYKNSLLRFTITDALHKKAEISNFLSLFSQSLKSVEEIDESMNTTARYVADLIEAESICIFELEGEWLRAVGISGAFPPLHKASQYVLTKPKYILESLRREKIKLGEGIVGEVAERRESIFLEQANNDPMLAEIDTVVPINTLMAIPLVSEANVTGVICAVNNRRSDRPFSAEQFSRFKFIASQVVLAQNLVKVYASLSEQQRINQELEFARQLQASLLPEAFPSWDQFMVHSFTRSSKEVSGDFYDFVEIDDHRLLIVVGDACGKGIPACMLMAMTRSFIRSMMERFTTLKDLLQELNYNLFRDTAEERFVTLGCCLLDKKSSTLEYARAGHTELLVYVRNHIRHINPNGTALGLLPAEMSEFDTICLEFTPGMSILMFTDGINEAINANEEEFGAERLESAFMSSCAANCKPEQTVEKLLKAVDGFTGDMPQTDDQTIVIINHL